MKLFEAMNLHERNVHDIAKEYNGLRKRVELQLKGKKDGEKLKAAISGWVGGMEGLKSVRQLIGMLQKNPAFKNDAVDKAIIKIINELIRESSDERSEVAKKQQASTKRQEKMQTVIPPGTTLSTGV